MDQNTLQQLLSGLPLGAVRYLEETASTNDDALHWLEQGAPDASLVYAGKQTHGRGRFERTWYNTPEASLAFSIIFHAGEMNPEAVSLLAPFAGLAVCKALEASLHLSPRIKWPNDVLLDGKKVAGILSEAVWEGSACKGVVVGVGVNVALESVPPWTALAFPAGSIQEAAGRTADRWELLHAVIAEMLISRPMIGSSIFFREWEERLAFRGERVDVFAPAGIKISGRLIGISPAGSLRIRLDDGTTRDVEAGDLSLRPAPWQ
jgi:BirA family biotin operon repressor/biotin-[acetyl-CoA-carboxylase] ligase